MSQTRGRLAIVGGGAAGFFCAANLSEFSDSLDIVVYEASSRFLSKVAISGGGRCNVTHNCFEIAKLVEAYPRGQSELKGPFSRFSPEDTVAWFAAHAVELKTESDGRIFPVTDSSQTIIDCLYTAVKTKSVSLNLRTAVKSVIRHESRFELELTNGKREIFDFVLLASGSSKSGHFIANSFGHSITECAPSLFTFKSNDLRIRELAGVSFTNAKLYLKPSSGKVFEQTGPLLITHWGLSGPAVLKISAFAARELAHDRYQATLYINWIAEVTDCSQTLASLRKLQPKKEIGSSPQFSLTRRFWERLLEFCNIPSQLHCFELSNQHIKLLSDVLLKSEIRIEGKGEFKEEFVTCGGVDLQEVDFRSFESKIVPNLFFAGEILDIDGITGGFNFQAAWTAAWIVAQKIKEKIGR